MVEVTDQGRNPAEEILEEVDRLDPRYLVIRGRGLLNLGRYELPSPSTLCGSFNCGPMSVWQSLLSRSTKLLHCCGKSSINSTFFARHQASPHYFKRVGRSVDTLKITFLIDTADHVILVVHRSAKWPNDAKIGPKLTARNYENGQIRC